MRSAVRGFLRWLSDMGVPPGVIVGICVVIFVGVMWLKHRNQ